MVNRIPIAASNAYADVLDRLQDQRLDDLSAEPGNYISKTVAGRVYWYRQFTSGGKRQQAYVGAETPELLARIEKQKRQRTSEKDQASLVRMLVRSNSLPAPPPAVGNTLAVLAASGLFRLRCVLVGTVAYQTYAGMLGVRLPNAGFATEDVDLAQSRAISVAVEDASAPPVMDALRQADETFEPILRPGRGIMATSYQSETVKIEFLTPMRGPEEVAPVSLPSLGTMAQPLRFLDFLIFEEVPAVVLHRSGVLVNVPDPVRYAWHKLIVSQRRAPFAAQKAQKDVLQAEALFDVLAQDRPEDVLRLWQELSGPGRKNWQEIAMGGFRRMASDVQTKVGTILKTL